MINDPTPSTPAPAPSSPPTLSASSAPTALASPLPDIEIDELTPDQAASMIGWAKDDLAKGTITQDQANKMFEELGATPEQRASDTRSEEVKALDQQFPPATPDEYLIRYSRPGQDVPMTPEIKAFDQSARTWMSEAGLPRELGNALVNQIDRVTEHTKTMMPEQLVAYGYAEMAKLESIYGTALNEKLRAAGRMVVELDAKKPGLKNLLKSQGIGDNAMVASRC